MNSNIWQVGHSFHLNPMLHFLDAILSYFSFYFIFKLFPTFSSFPRSLNVSVHQGLVLTLIFKMCDFKYHP